MKQGDVPPQVEQGVQLDGPLATTKPCPRKQAQAQVDRGGIQRIDGLLQVHGQRIADVQVPRPFDQHLRKVCIDTPVVSPGGIGQRAPRDTSAKARMIEFGAQRPQTGFDVAQTLAKRQLCERQTQKLIAAREPARPSIAPIPAHARVEFVSRQELHQLRKHQRSRMHLSISAKGRNRPSPEDTYGPS